MHTSCEGCFATHRFQTGTPPLPTGFAGLCPTSGDTYLRLGHIGRVYVDHIAFLREDGVDLEKQNREGKRGRVSGSSDSPKVRATIGS